jgi:hypothetical protein
MDISLTVKGYEGARLVAHEERPLAPECRFDAFGCAAVTETVSEGDVTEVRSRFLFARDCALPSAVGACVSLHEHTRGDYVFVPAAVYDGNRFDVFHCNYPPALDRAHQGADRAVTISDVPRLSRSENHSRIQLTSGDMATPCGGAYSPSGKRGVLVFFKHKTRLGYNGLTLEEDLEAGVLRVLISAPTLREGRKYSFGGEQAGEVVGSSVQESEAGGWVFGADAVPSDDEAHLFREGEETLLTFCVHHFEARSLAEFFDRFLSARKSFEETRAPFDSLTHSEAFHYIERKYNARNFRADYGYYAVGTEPGEYQDFQSGWVGGGMSTLPLLKRGQPLSVERSKRTLAFMTRVIQNENGFFRPIFSGGKFFGDNFAHSVSGNELLIRKHCDVVYSFCAQYALYPDAALGESIRRGADALARLWARHGQLGQLIDCETEEILVGGTACAALAPAALVAAHALFPCGRYLETARASAERFYRERVRPGFINGGPGEILQGADSESAFSLLESFVALYEETGEEQFLTWARETAAQCASWCVSYDFEFPKNSCFGMLDMHTTGSVFANIQNKHAAPGLCTLAGDGLLKLYRHTGDERYLELLTDIARGVTQYVACPERPIWSHDGTRLPDGYVNERVNMSDWEGKACVGGVFHGSCWPEISCMLTYTQLPSVYINRRYGACAVLDHVQCEWEAGRCAVANTKTGPVVVLVLIDDERGSHEQIFELAPGERVNVG